MSWMDTDASSLESLSSQHTKLLFVGKKDYPRTIYLTTLQWLQKLMDLFVTNQYAGVKSLVIEM